MIGTYFHLINLFLKGQKQTFPVISLQDSKGVNHLMNRILDKTERALTNDDSKARIDLFDALKELEIKGSKAEVNNFVLQMNKQDTLEDLDSIKDYTHKVSSTGSTQNIDDVQKLNNLTDTVQKNLSSPSVDSQKNFIENLAELFTFYLNNENHFTRIFDEYENTQIPGAMTDF